MAALTVAESTVAYARAQLSDGLPPEAARTAVLEVAGELVRAADVVRRVSRLQPGQRRAMARTLAGRGWSTSRIAAQLGVTERSVRNYVAGRVTTGARR